MDITSWCGPRHDVAEKVSFPMVVSQGFHARGTTIFTVVRCALGPVYINRDISLGWQKRVMYGEGRRGAILIPSAPCGHVGRGGRGDEMGYVLCEGMRSAIKGMSDGVNE
jgi:hypothetical protein